MLNVPCDDRDPARETRKVQVATADDPNAPEGGMDLFHRRSGSTRFNTANAATSGEAPRADFDHGRDPGLGGFSRGVRAGEDDPRGLGPQGGVRAANPIRWIQECVR
ncbi:hypothetical protein [Pendulispora albinea]|uniref:Uncharacterized protein n=1 Tax=Pendulispora albinea TaxID=2741071 RepID=A0ABZ2M0L5_9BACT